MYKGLMQRNILGANDGVHFATVACTLDRSISCPLSIGHTQVLFTAQLFNFSMKFHCPNVHSCREFKPAGVITKGTPSALTVKCGSHLAT